MIYIFIDNKVMAILGVSGLFLPDMKSGGGYVMFMTIDKIKTYHSKVQCWNVKCRQLNVN